MTRRLLTQDISSLRAHIANIYACGRPNLRMRLEIMAEAQEQLATRPYLGITVADASRESGACVKRVNEGTPGYRQGIEQGDVIKVFGGMDVKNKQQFMKRLKATSPGDVVWMEIIRRNRLRTLMIKVGSRQDSLDIRALQLKAMGVVTESDVKEWRSKIDPHHTSGSDGETPGATTNASTAVAGKVSMASSSPLNLSMDSANAAGTTSSSSEEGVVYSGTPESLYSTAERIREKLSMLRNVSAFVSKVLKDTEGCKKQLQDMQAAQKNLKEVRRYLGIQVESVAGQGMLVTRVSPSSPGEMQGIRKGDVIHKLNGVLVPTLKTWLKCLNNIAPGNIVVLDIIRGTETTIAVIEVGTRRLSFEGLHQLYQKAAGQLCTSKGGEAAAGGGGGGGKAEENFVKRKLTHQESKNAEKELYE